MVYFRQAQGAMEFLMAYGWAIVAVLLTIGALAYFGVINTSVLFPESCSMFPGVACTDFYANKAEMVLTLRNGGGVPYSTFSVGIAGCSTGNAQGGLLDGERENIVLPGCSFIDDKAIRKDLQITYTSGGVLHTRTGRINTFVDENYIMNGGFEFDSGLNYGNGGNAFDEAQGFEVPDGWLKAGSAQYLDSSERLSGLYSQRFYVVSTADTYPNVFRLPKIPITPGTYNLTLWAKKAAGPIGGRIIIKIDDVDSSGVIWSTLATSNVYSVSTNWQKWGKAFTVPSDGHGYVTVYTYTGSPLGCGSVTPCTIYMDDAKLVRLS